jgi:hypothetical protein
MMLTLWRQGRLTRLNCNLGDLLTSHKTPSENAENKDNIMSQNETTDGKSPSNGLSNNINSKLVDKNMSNGNGQVKGIYNNQNAANGRPMSAVSLPVAASKPHCVSRTSSSNGGTVRRNNSKLSESDKSIKKKSVECCSVM